MYNFVAPTGTTPPETEFELTSLTIFPESSQKYARAIPLAEPIPVVKLYNFPAATSIASALCNPNPESA